MVEINSIMIIIKIILSALLNRCRGSQWFGFIPSTSIGRILACVGLTLVNTPTYNPICLLLMSLAFFNWAVYAWDVYWGAAAQSPNTIIKPAFKPTDWILSKLPLSPGSRWWGIIGMGLRQGLCAIPVFLILTYFTNEPVHLIAALGPFLFGFVYAAASFINKTQFVMIAELVIGACWALLMI